MSKYDAMIACNRKVSVQKIELAQKTILDMMDKQEKITVPKLMAQTGLSRGFFYKNPAIRKLLDKALEQQAGMPDPRRGIFDMAMEDEILTLKERIRRLEQENRNLKEENERLHRAADRRNIGLFHSL
ncbi:MAG: DUF6262 family protein [Butyrivibrio sp.]|nr:DUF6262 family protein [Butyrivibrio sp.]